MAINIDIIRECLADYTSASGHSLRALSSVVERWNSYRMNLDDVRTMHRALNTLDNPPLTLRPLICHLRNALFSSEDSMQSGVAFKPAFFLRADFINAVRLHRGSIVDGVAYPVEFSQPDDLLQDSYVARFEVVRNIFVQDLVLRETVKRNIFLQRIDEWTSALAGYEYVWNLNEPRPRLISLGAPSSHADLVPSARTGPRDGYEAARQLNEPSPVDWEHDDPDTLESLLVGAFELGPGIDALTGSMNWALNQLGPPPTPLSSADLDPVLPIPLGSRSVS